MKMYAASAIKIAHIKIRGLIFLNTAYLDDVGRSEL
jgi:hypothetical protein